MPAPTVVELLWGTGRPAKRGPKPSLSLEAIVGAAIELADAEGMAGVSMQRVAERLGYTKMSLYRYVPGKAELAALMLEQALGAPPDITAPPGIAAAPDAAAASVTAGRPETAAAPDAAAAPDVAARPETAAAPDAVAAPDQAARPDHAAQPNSAAAQAGFTEAPWRAGLRRWTEEIFRRYRAHPWSLELSAGVRPMGPNELAWLEAALTAMAGIGLTGPERLDTVVVLNGHVRSLANQNGGTPADGMEEQLMRQMGEVMEAAGDRYPEVTAALSEQAGGGSARDDALNFGIDRILDGLQVLVERRR
ncbi:TetR/AcrR family transcriptional regulator C-terminal domain-containing protein [Nocardia cyriacigeorgica]|uniref:TetR/AcrR family transcriptional regulator n=1 Tax=Nocardia cyriacigeorgica TaxID=135487 RepID=UPI001893E2AA|nr:TetR/AcrR family transcriptional regulator C-terminal domain-containing protein [Nocardia cyriacigeorgica]